MKIVILWTSQSLVIAVTANLPRSDLDSLVSLVRIER